MTAKFINNAKVIHSLGELPKIGGRYFDNRTHTATAGTCYSIEAYEDEKHPDFIFYKAYFSERLHTETKNILFSALIVLFLLMQ